MGKKKIIIPIILLVFSAIGYAWKNLSEPSQDLLKKLDAVVKKVNKKESGFYNRVAELEKTKKEFGIGAKRSTSLREYAEEIKNNMKNITFKIKETQDLQLTFPIEYFEWLKKINKEIEFSTVKEFWMKSKEICSNSRSYEKLFNKALSKVLSLAFIDESEMLSFVNNTLKSVNYDNIEKLFNQDNKKIGRIFDKSGKCYKVKGDLLKECDYDFLNWMKNKKDFCRELGESFNALISYKVYNLKNSGEMKEGQIPKLFVPYKPVNKFHYLGEISEKIFRRYIVESITFKKLFKAISDILNIKDIEKSDDEDDDDEEDSDSDDDFFEQKEYAIIVFPTSAKKTFPKKREVFTVEYVNSASNSYECLLIYHKEELLKALLHELNHNIKLVDFDKDLLKFKKGHFAIGHEINQDIATYEVIVESMACVTNVIMTAYEKDPGKFFHFAAEMWEREKLFATYQAAKILYLNGFENLEQFYKSEKDGPKVEQKTWAAEYHILKAAVIQNINKLLAIFMDSKNKDKDKRVKAIKNLINEQIKDKVFERKVNGFIKAFKKEWIPNKKTKEWSLGRPISENFLFETGRFSIIDPGF